MDSPGRSDPDRKNPACSPTCDWVLNKAQQRARLLIDVEADAVVLSWDLDDEVGVPIH